MLHVYRTNVCQWLLKNNDRKLPQMFNCCVRYISDVLSLNNCVFGDYLYLIYQSESEVMDTHKSVSYLHRYLEIDNLNIKSKTLWKTWWLHSSNSGLT